MLRHHQLPVSPIRVGTDQVMPVSAVRNLGVYMDADVSMRLHVSKTVAACFAILRQPRSIRRSGPRFVLQSLVSSLVLQRLDYGNATLAGIPSYLTKRMQSVLNCAAQLVFSALRYDRITPLLTQLHWLKVPQRIKFKLLFWYTQHAYTRQLRRTLLRNFISHLLTRLVSVSALHRHHRLLSDAPVFQPSAIELSRSLLPDCGTLCRWTSRRRRQYLFSGNIWRPIFSVIISLNPLYCLCNVFVISDTIIDLFIYLLTYLPLFDLVPRCPISQCQVSRFQH